MLLFIDIILLALGVSRGNWRGLSGGWVFEQKLKSDGGIKRMKIEIALPISNLRLLKGVLQTLHKVLFDDKKVASIFLAYFVQSHQIRILVDSEHCLCILALDPKITIADRSALKEEAELLAIEFAEAEAFLRNTCELVDREGSGDVTLTLSRDKAVGNEEPFRSLNFLNGNDKYRNEIFKPIYDAPRIVNHVWLNGCHSEQKKVEFDLESEHLLSLLRFVFRHKETQAKEKMIYLHFNFREGRVEASLEKLKHHSEGEILEPEFKQQRFRGNYLFSVPPSCAGKVYELFMGKSSGRRFIISTHDRLIFHYYHSGVFESQILLQEWIRFERFEPLYPLRLAETKMEN
jgi:hypothetical protein